MPEMMDGKNAARPAEAVIHEGDVLERIHVPNYTYLRLSSGGGETWAAVPKTEIEVGAHVRVV
jgi:membrane protein implicated in regulation of membrane protease activity